MLTLFIILLLHPLHLFILLFYVCTFWSPSLSTFSPISQSPLVTTSFNSFYKSNIPSYIPYIHIYIYIYICIYVYMCMCACSVTSVMFDSLWHYGLLPTGSSISGVLQARILERVAMPSSRGFSKSRDRTCISFMAGGFFATETLGKPYI